jgi:hypothetical protein
MKRLAILTAALSLSCAGGLDTALPASVEILVERYTPQEAIDGVPSHDGMPLVRRCRDDDGSERCESVSWATSDGLLHVYALEESDGWVDVWWVR